MNINLNLHIHIHMTCSTPLTAETTGSSSSGLHLSDIEAGVALRNEGHKSMKTIGNYMTALRSFRRFLQDDALLEQITEETIEAYARWLRQKGVATNTASCYMRSLRAVIKQVGGEADKLFDGVFTGSSRTVKRAATQQAIIALQTLCLPRQSYAALVRDVFLFSFYAQGMPFVDVAHLCRQQIADGRLDYDRQKTGQHVSVRMEPCMTDIVRRYEVSGSDFVFPFLRDSKPDQQQTTYLRELNRYNRTLKQLAKRAGIEQNLTSYVARHTWASEAYRNNVALPIIARALGHADPQTTLIYVKEIDDAPLAEANARLLSKYGETSP